jgi:hypothetical protein
VNNERAYIEAAEIMPIQKRVVALFVDITVDTQAQWRLYYPFSGLYA